MNPSEPQNPHPAPRDAYAQPRTQPPVNRPNEPHAGDHLSQYGMRSKQAVDGAASAENAPEEMDGVQAFDDEYSAREARDQHARSIPTGAQEPTGVSGSHRPTPRE